MIFVIKIGSLYLTSDGTWTTRQADALRVYEDTADGCDSVRVSSHGDRPVRLVRLTQHTEPSL